MIATIEPGWINGGITAPPSKSLTQRAVAAALLHKGSTAINNAGYSADEQAAVHIIRQLGADVTEIPSSKCSRQLLITSNGIAPITDRIDCGESGLSTRLFTPIAALHNAPITIDGHGSLLGRPMKGIDVVLSQLGVSFDQFSGHVPFSVRGPLRASSLRMDAAGSSQLLSGLLFALTASATTPISIGVRGLESKPYIDLTMDVLAHFGRPITHRKYREFFIDPAAFTFSQYREIDIESDWSSAAFMLVAGAIAGQVTVSNLNTQSLQADRAVMDVLLRAGADMTIAGNSVTTRKSRMQAFEYDATDSPDLFPVLAALAAFCPGDSRILGVHRLFHKESNRVESITELLWSFGVPFSVEDDTLCIAGAEKLHGTIIESYNDHRIVMAAAVCGLRARGRTDISGAEAVNKSYPTFFDDLVACGARATLLL